MAIGNLPFLRIHARGAQSNNVALSAISTVILCKVAEDFPECGVPHRGEFAMHFLLLSVLRLCTL